MTAELIDRKKLKEEVGELLSGAQVSPRAMTALYAGLLLILNLVCAFTGEGILSTFVSFLTSLLSVLLGAGCTMYCMAIRRGERVEYLTLFDGRTGAALDTINYNPGRGTVSAWGDSYGNRVDRFLGAVMYLDGERPSAVTVRGCIVGHVVFLAFVSELKRQLGFYLE